MERNAIQEKMSKTGADKKVVDKSLLSDYLGYRKNNFYASLIEGNQSFIMPEQPSKVVSENSIEIKRGINEYIVWSNEHKRQFKFNIFKFDDSSK